MDGADLGAARGPVVAAVASAIGGLSIGGTTGPRTTDLVETAGHATGGLCRVDLLPGPDAAVVPSRSAGVGPGLPALWRFGCALRGNGRGNSEHPAPMGRTLCSGARRRPLGRRPAQTRGQL